VRRQLQVEQDSALAWENQSTTNVTIRPENAPMKTCDWIVTLVRRRISVSDTHYWVGGDDFPFKTGPVAGSSAGDRSSGFVDMRCGFDFHVMTAITSKATAPRMYSY